MAMIPICDGRQISSTYHDVSHSNDSCLYKNTDSDITVPVLNRSRRSPNVIRPCYYILQILGMWKPMNGKFESLWRVYRGFIFLVLLPVCLAAIMCLDFVHNGFTKKSVDVREIMNNACTCLDFLCPFVFTVYYFHKGQFVEVVTCVQNVSEEWCQKLRRIARWYSLMSVLLWGLCILYLIMHWFPFFSKPWHYAVYVPVIVYIAGWWGTWLTIYGFVCHVHSLQIDVVIQEMKSAELNATTIFKKFSQLQTSLEETQKDFNVIISLALAYHTLDLIVFSFAYLSSAFGSDYPLWQFVGTVLYDLASLIFKLYPPAVVAAAVHRIVVQACKRCRESLVTTDLPLEDMQLFQYMVLCEPDMGLKILGIRITVELSMKILMAIFTAAISFVSFVLGRLK